MPDRIFGDREKAMEDAYFRQEEAKLLEKLRHKADLDDIALALGEKLQIDDPALLQEARDLGITWDTAPALFLAPLVQVAWAEGKVSKAEHSVVLRLAKRRGVEPGSAAYSQLEEWLRVRPSDALFAGYGFYILDGKPVWLWNLIDLERLKWEGKDALTPGKHVIEFDFVYDGLGAGTLAFNDFSGVGRPGTGTLKVDGVVVDTKQMPKTLPMILQWDANFDIGSDTLTGVNDADYQPPFPLTAKLNKLTIKVDRPKLSPEDVKKFEKAEAEALDGAPLKHVQAGPE